MSVYKRKRGQTVKQEASLQPGPWKPPAAVRECRNWQRGSAYPWRREAWWRTTQTSKPYTPRPPAGSKVPNTKGFSELWRDANSDRVLPTASPWLPSHGPRGKVTGDQVLQRRRHSSREAPVLLTPPPRQLLCPIQLISRTASILREQCPSEHFTSHARLYVWSMCYRCIHA